MLRALLSRRLCQVTYSLQTHGSIRCLTKTDVETDAEKKLAETLASKIDATVIRVRDISGGCGAMYEISVESEIFRGKRKVQQHRIVNEALSEEVKAMHGLRIHTEVPS
ncbi:bolA-like protein 3 [Exaiptasia diaphana]|uniref:BolA-like protein 3 n=1 Tax=Exaiptasia diaphana TaxID=2652724 RepID=A0A913XEX1_EXADI|nr:bolA-like protein 3 [Exaiptasia diaphana]KXJ12787.1 BolA-like protein 3 [Exaiptasia diaphana]